MHSFPGLCADAHLYFQYFVVLEGTAIILCLDPAGCDRLLNELITNSVDDFQKADESSAKSEDEK